MTRLSLVPLAVSALLGFCAPAGAQTLYGNMNPSGNPISPYLNLNRFGAPGAVNYYGLVIPQMQTQAALGNLQQGLNALGGYIDPYTGEFLQGGATGHPAAFGNYSHYYPTLGSGMGMGIGQFSGQRNLMMQRRRYSPIYNLGGMQGSGLGGMGSGSQFPGVGGGGGGGGGVPRGR